MKLLRGRILSPAQNKFLVRNKWLKLIKSIDFNIITVYIFSNWYNFCLFRDYVFGLFYWPRVFGLGVSSVLFIRCLSLFSLNEYTSLSPVTGRGCISCASFSFRGGTAVPRERL